MTDYHETPFAEDFIKERVAAIAAHDREYQAAVSFLNDIETSGAKWSDVIGSNWGHTVGVEENRIKKTVIAMLYAELESVEKISPALMAYLVKRQQQVGEEMPADPLTSRAAGELRSTMERDLKTISHIERYRKEAASNPRHI